MLSNANITKTLCHQPELFAKPPLTPEVPIKSFKRSLRKRCNSLQNDVPSSPVTPTGDVISPFFHDTHCIDQNLRNETLGHDNTVDANSNQTNSNLKNVDSTKNVFINNSTKTKQRLGGREVNIFAAIERNFDKRVNIDIPSPPPRLLNIRNDTEINILEKQCDCNCHLISPMKDSYNTALFMNSKQTCVSCRCYILQNVAKHNVKMTNVLPTLNLSTESIDEEEDSANRTKQSLSQPCSPTFSPLLDWRRPISARTETNRPISTIDENNQNENPYKSSHRLLERRSTINPRSGLITFERWLERKSNENRRRSVDAFASYERQEKEKEHKVLEGLVRGKTFDEWKREKDEKLKGKFNEKRKEEEKRKQKLEYVQEHEKLIERKYNEWLLKKYEKDVSSELYMIQEIRKKTKDGQQNDISDLRPLFGTVRSPHKRLARSKSSQS